MTCEVPNAREGTNVEPQKGKLSGYGASCEGVIPLNQCEAACGADPKCNAIHVSWHSATHERYLKVGGGACAIVNHGKMCPRNVDRDQAQRVVVPYALTVRDHQRVFHVGTI